LALVNRGIGQQRPSGHGAIDEIVQTLNAPGGLCPQPKEGALAPAFLGLVPTRRCNLACRYCGFVPEDDERGDMSPALAHDVVDWYLRLVSQAQQPHAEIHYFGGEPFCATDVLDVTVHQAHIWSEETGFPVRFEAATNGVFDERRAEWAGDNLDTIVVSLDGFPELHDRHRPYANGQGSFAAVDHTVRILSQASTDLFLRVCVTTETVDRMPDISRWFCDHYRPRGVCFEPIQLTTSGSQTDFEPPDPWAFAANFLAAGHVLEERGVEAVYAAADITNLQASFCPVGQDVVIVAPDGTLNSCYLLPRDWEARGMDLRLGCMGENHVPCFDEDAVAYSRSLNVNNKRLCAQCLCKWHCAGGCHVNHLLPAEPGDYDRLCIQTRIITVCNILRRMGRHDLMDRWLADRNVMEATIYQASDLLEDVDGAL
jgi:uncharacterized protein